MVLRDVVTNLFRRLGMVGAIVLASALILGAIAGGVIVHRIDTTSTASSEQAQGDESGQENPTAAAKGRGSKNAHKGHHDSANKGHEDSSEAEDAQDKDV